MTLFFISAALLVLLSLGWLLSGLFRANAASTDQEAVNITLARERRDTLELALATGAIDQSTYDYECEQLAYDLASDLNAASESSSQRGGHITAAVLVSVFIPVAAGALYLHLGNPSAITQARDSASADRPTDTPLEASDIADLLPKMEERLSEQPDDIEGWRLLGRSYLSLGNYTGARRAFERALALDEQDVPTMTQLAETIAMTQQGDLAGEPLRYVEQANALDPDNEHALWLLSIAQQQAGNHESAMQGFDRLIDMAAGNAEALATVNQMRNLSVEALSGSTAGTDPASNSQQTTDTQTPVAGTSVLVSVDVSDEARSASSGEQVVFVFATASQGPPMPLAVGRLVVADLPATIILDDSSAMVPKMTLSAFDLVTIGARISTAGDAIAQSGEWFDEALQLDPNTVGEVELFIDRQTP